MTENSTEELLLHVHERLSSMENAMWTIAIVLILLAIAKALAWISDVD